MDIGDLEDGMAGRNIDEKLRCSFCNKTQDQVKKLIAGHNGVYICDECVEICSDILDEEFETESDGVDTVDGMNINLLKPKQIKEFLDDYVIGQDDIHAMEDMIDAYADGCEIVYGVRSNRSTDTFWKRFTAQSYYKFLNALGGNVVYNHADYRLVSNRVLQEFSHFEEVNLFLRGMFPLVGFKSTSVYYERHERMAGKSHYPLSKMLALAFDGITSLSNKPIRMISMAGILVSLLGFIGIIWAVIAHMTGQTVAGWASMVCMVCFIGGIQLICTGVLGEYIGKIYMEVKHRPRYIISERTGNLSQEQKTENVN